MTKAPRQSLNDYTEYKDSDQIMARIKIWLLNGCTITHNEAQDMFGTNRLASYIHRLRRTMNISMERVYDGKHQYGRYFIPKKKKERKF